MEKIESGDNSFWEFKGIAESTDKRFLMSSPFPLIFILTTYLWFVLKFGPEFMKNRKPYKLDKIIPIYNLIQVLTSSYVIYLGYRFMPYWEVTRFVWTKCYSKINYVQLTDCAHCYMMSKFVELLDTVFFVLRKKQRQISFLHVYHHALMVFCTWCVVKYSVNDGIILAGLLNSIVHVIMYSYYGLSMYPALKKYLWWKKYITVMQLVQFCLVFINITVGNFVSECQKSYILLGTMTSNVILFLYLFVDFYSKSYTKETKNNTKNVLEKVTEATATEVTPNGKSKNGLNCLINRHKRAAEIDCPQQLKTQCKKNYLKCEKYKFTL